MDSDMLLRPLSLWILLGGPRHEVLVVVGGCGEPPWWKSHLVELAVGTTGSSWLLQVERGTVFAYTRLFRISRLRPVLNPKPITCKFLLTKHREFPLGPHASARDDSRTSLGLCLYVPHFGCLILYLYRCWFFYTNVGDKKL